MTSYWWEECPRIPSTLWRVGPQNPPWKDILRRFFGRQGVHPGRLTWNIIIGVWFRSFSFLFMGDLYVPYVNLPGVYIQEYWKFCSLLCMSNFTQEMLRFQGMDENKIKQAGYNVHLLDRVGGMLMNYTTCTWGVCAPVSSTVYNSIIKSPAVESEGEGGGILYQKHVVKSSWWSLCGRGGACPLLHFFDIWSYVIL